MFLSPLVRSLPALAASALLAASPAQGGERAAQLRVGARVVSSCRFEASVPRMGAPNRADGSASFSVTCTHDGAAKAAPCPRPCAPVVADDRRRADRLVETRDDGTTVATVLF